MVQLDVIGLSRTLTGGRLVTKTSLAARYRVAKFVIGAKFRRPIVERVKRTLKMLAILLGLSPSTSETF